ncbi:response regulator [Cyanobacterium sp. Dongsha4]|uniref:response regulator transcription factor n=1 Tax=Cyanobacterium sp. DS4 TaxID=2878255 RepID=UPI002E80E876|nr:response regulator [Cyanobacterium sp. Dongsha4]WVL01513.1 response regulator [Cyanobacterium sp. Dongsha4]
MVKILVIEDEKEIRENILQILRLNNYEATGVENGKLGWEVARENPPDLVICDIMMPEMDGYQFIERLRIDEKTLMTPCIFVTAKVDKKDIRMGMRLGADDYLTKPFTPDELLEAVDVRLQRKKELEQEFDAKLEKNRKLVQDILEKIKEKDKKIKNNENMLELKDEIISKLIVNMSNPVNNMNMAIRMLADAESEEKRQSYLRILQEECSKEIGLLNEIKELQKILTPENISVLLQFNLLK